MVMVKKRVFKPRWRCPNPNCRGNRRKLTTAYIEQAVIPGKKMQRTCLRCGNIETWELPQLPQPEQLI